MVTSDPPACRGGITTDAGPGTDADTGAGPDADTGAGPARTPARAGAGAQTALGPPSPLRPSTR